MKKFSRSPLIIDKFELMDTLLVGHLNRLIDMKYLIIHHELSRKMKNIFLNWINRIDIQ